MDRTQMRIKTVALPVEVQKCRINLDTIGIGDITVALRTIFDTNEPNVPHAEGAEEYLLWVWNDMVEEWAIRATQAAPPVLGRGEILE
jgi:hypothetical protein